MTDDAVLMLVWRCNGETLVIPTIDRDGNDTLLMRELVDALPERVKGTAEAAVLRGIVADQRGQIGDLRVRLQENAGKIAQLVIDNNYLNGLVYTVPVEEKA